MMTLARAAPTLIVGLVAASVVIGVSGCTTYATPDGHTLWSANGPNDVERVLGEADLVVESIHFDWGGPWLSTQMTYIDRGYVVKLSNSRVRRITPTTEDRADLERQSAAYKNVLKGKIKRGDTGAAVIAALGEPDIVSMYKQVNGIRYPDGGGHYAGEFVQSPPVFEVTGYWEAEDVCVDLEWGRVYQFRPMRLSDRKSLRFFQEQLDQSGGAQ